MFTARLKDTGEIIHADDYQHSVAKKGAEPELCCGNPDCQGRVHFREGSAEMGDAHARSSHFAAHDVLDHPGCDWVTEPSSETKRTMSMMAAFGAGRHVVINLNFNLGLTPLHGEFRRQSDIWEADTPYTHVLKALKGDYQAISVKTAPELMAQIAKARQAFGDDVTKKIYVGNNLEVLPYDDFDLSGDKAKLKALWRSMVYNENHEISVNGTMVTFSETAERTRGGLIKSIPRLFRFNPTKGSLSRKFGSVKASPTLIDEQTHSKFLLLLDIDPADKAQRAAVTQDGGIYLLASAQLNGQENYAKLRFYQKGGADQIGQNGQKDNVFTSIKLTLVNDAQFVAAADLRAGVHPTNKPPQRDFDI